MYLDYVANQTKNSVFYVQNGRDTQSLYDFIKQNQGLMYAVSFSSPSSVAGGDISCYLGTSGAEAYAKSDHFKSHYVQGTEGDSLVWFEGQHGGMVIDIDF